MTPADGARAHGPVRAPVRTARRFPAIVPRLLAGAAILAAALSRLAARAGLAALACVVLLSAAAPVQAQTELTLVGNHQGQFDPGPTLTQIVAQSFRTGGAAQGYTLSEIRIRLQDLPSTLPTSAVVKIRQTSRDGTVVVTLTNPSSFTEDAFNTFTPSANIALARNTTYWVTVNEDTGNNRVEPGYALDEPVGLHGWSTGSVAYQQSSPTAEWAPYVASMMMEVRGWVTGGNSDMTLKKLELTAGSDTVSLTPAFHKNTLDYTVLFDEDVSSVTVTTETTESRARVRINLVDATTRTLPVRLGRSEIGVRVTSSDEAHTVFYRVTMARGSSDATLGSLRVSDGGNPVSLTPAFATDTTEYRARVAESVSRVTVAGTTSDNDARLVFSRLFEASGNDDAREDSATYRLRHGANTLKVIAVAQNGTFQTYTVHLIREGPPPLLENATVWGNELNLQYSTHLRPDGPGNLLAPPPSAYTVLVDGAPVSVTGTAIISQFVVLTLARSVTHRERNVRVSYTPPSLPDDAVQTPLGGRAAAVSERAVQTITPSSGPGTGGVSGKQLFYTKMTVAHNSKQELFGYDDGSGDFAAFGSLGRTGFPFNGETRSIKSLFFEDRSPTPLTQTLSGSLTQDAAANLALYVGGTRFRFADADSFRVSINTRDWSDSGLTWADGQVVPVLIVDENKAPVFKFGDWLRKVFENPDGIVDVEAPIVATDPDGHTLTGYTLAGRDADKFTIDASTGQLRTKADVVYDYETQGTCVVKFSFTVESGGCFNVVVQATDRYGAVGEKPVAVFLLNDKYDPTVQAVRVEAVAGTAGVLRLSWVAPEKRPTGYEVWYSTRDTATGGNVKRPGADATSLEIPFLEADTEYHVQIRGRFDDSDTNIYYDPERGSYGQGPWTKAQARTGAAIPGAKPAVSLGLPKGVKVRGTGARRVVRLPVGGAARFRIEVSDIVNSHEWRARRPVGIKVCYRDYWRDPTGQAPVRLQGGCPADQSTGLAVLADDGFAVISGTTAHVALVKQINSAALESGPYRATLGPGLDYRLETDAVTELCFEVATDVGYVPNPCTGSKPPELLSAALLGQSGDNTKVVVLQFDERLRQERLPTRGAFMVRVGGEPVRLDTLAPGDNDGQLKLTLGVPVKMGQTATVSYVAPGFGGVLQDADGNRVLSFAGVTVTHSSTVTGPAPLSAWRVNFGGDVIVLFDVPLDFGNLPAADKFAFNATGYAVDGVMINQNPDVNSPNRDREVVVRPSISLPPRTVTVSYSDPTTGNDVAAIQDTAGTDAVSFRIVVTAPPPVLESATVPAAGDLVELIFDRALDAAAGRTPPASAFTVTLDDDDMEATDAEITAVAVSGTARRVRLTVTTRIREGQSVTVSYVDSGPVAAIQNTDGVDAASFADEAVTNNSEIGPLELQSVTVHADGTPVELNYGQPLDATVRTPPASAFRLMVDNAVVRPSSVAVGALAGQVLLTVSPTIKQHQIVTVRYTDPDRGDNRAIRNLEGEAAPDFDTEDDEEVEVTNGSTVPDPTPPTARSVRLVDYGGGDFAITVVFSRAINFDLIDEITPEQLVSLAGRFVAVIDGTRYSALSAGGSQNEFTVEFDPGIFVDATRVTLEYRDPTPGVDDAIAVQNRNGVDVDSFTIDVDLSRGLSLSVADVTVAEAADATADFVVTLSPAAATTVTVDYATSDGTAIAGSDYTATSGTLTFLAGETTKTVSVPVTDDAHEDSGETFTLTLSNASGARIDDATATATITNDDPAAALAAAFQEMPATHDGNSAFSFELAFTEEPQSGFRSATLRDSSLEVAGGAVTSVRRLKKGKNKKWVVTVTPSTRETVTVTLPARTDCDVVGAVCTTDGRAIEVSLSAEVAGPDTGLDPAPRVTGASVVNGPGPNGAWDAGETVQAEVRFNAAVAVHGPPGVMPALAIVLDGERREAAYTGGAGTQTLTFAYPVVAADAGARRAWMAANGLILNGVVLRDNLEREAETDFGAVPYVTAVELVADASGDDIWTPGETIEAQLTFSEAVTVAGGAPTLKVTVAGKVTTLDYASGSGSTVLVFSRAVTDSSGTQSRIAVTADSLALNGASIVSTASGRAAAPGHDGTEATTATPALTAAFRNVPPEHDGTAFTLDLAFSEAPGSGLGAETLLDAALSATGGEVSEASRLKEGSNRCWRLTVTPDGAGEVSVTLAATADCAAEGAICTDDERPLAAAVTATVRAQLTVAFESVPEEHDGTGPIFFSFAFSEEPGTVTYQSMRTESLVMHLGGERILWGSGERPEKPKKRRWRVGVSLPSSPAAAGKADLTVEIAPRDTCEDTGAVCTPDGRMLSHTLSAVIQGPPGVSVADAPAPEAGASTLDFTVTLSRAAAETVTVDYASADGSAPDGATAGEDYTAASGTLTFAPGETGKTVPVAVLDDADDGETVTLTLTNASGNHAWLAEARATGTISNPDTAIRVTGVSVISGPGDNGTWDAGETVTAEVRFSAAVTVDGPPGTAPTLALLLDGTRREAVYTDGSGTQTLSFSHTVTAADAGALRARVAANGLALDGVTLAGAHGEDVETGFAVAPYVTAVELMPDASGDRSWTPGEMLEVRLTFSEAVTVAGGAPTLKVTAAGAAATLDYVSGPSSAVLVFSRAVTGTDGSFSQIALTADSLALGGASVVSAVSGLSAALGHDGTAATEPVLLRGRVALGAAFLDLPAEGHGGAAFTLKLQFSEEFPLSWQTPADSGIAVTNGTLSGLVRVTAGENREWTVTVTPDGSDDVTLTLPATTDCAAAKAICNGDDVPLSAAVSVTVPQTTGEQVTTLTLALTAAFLELPADGHGGAAFTLKLQFSEEFPLSWQTPADSGIAVTNGTLSGLVRVTAGENREWTVTVTPDGGDDVTLTLPATTDCAAAKAICNGDDVPLSAAVSVTVPATLAATVPETVEPPLTVTGSTLWSSTLTVGEPDFFGFIGSGNGGSLSNAGWSEDGRRHTVGQVDLALYSDRANELWVEFSPAPGNLDDLTLHAGESVKALSEAVRTGNRFAWPVGELIWAAGEEVFLLLTRRGEAAPYVTAVALAPDASGDRSWTVGETLEVRLTFSEAVTVAGGAPTLKVSAAGETATLDYVSGSGSAVLVFSRDVTGTDGSFSQIALTADSLALGGATLVSAVSGLAAALGHDGTVATELATVQQRQALTAAFLALPADGHAGSAFTLKLRFSEEFPLSYLTLRDSALSVTNGTLTGVARVSAGEDREWTVTVTPDGDAAVTVTLAAPADCAAANALCTGDNRPLSAALSVTVAGPEPGEPEEPAGEPLTVRFESIPAEHDGRSAVVFRLAFSEAPHQFGYRTLRDETLRIRQGEARPASKARRLDSSSNRRWEVTYQPVSNADITVALGPTLACGDDGAVCTENGRRLSNTVSTVIPGPPGLSVADAQVEEAAQATVDFTVILSRAAAETVTLEYATSDGTAVAGEDYTAASGTLSFSPGQTTQTVPVAVLDDPHDEGSETFTLVLSNPSGNHAWLSAARATGTISNSDPLPKGWLARFGRTSATQVLGLLDARFGEARAPASQLTLGILRD